MSESIGKLVKRRVFWGLGTSGGIDKNTTTEGALDGMAGDAFGAACDLEAGDCCGDGFKR